MMSGKSSPDQIGFHPGSKFCAGIFISPIRSELGGGLAALVRNHLLNDHWIGFPGDVRTGT
jgi:hypothetical protein